MGWSNPSTPNERDFYLFVQNEMQVPPSALPGPTVAPPLASPTITVAPGGSLPAGVVFLTVTYLSAYGESTPCAEQAVVVAAGDFISVASPPPVAFATGYNVYASPFTGAEVLQTGTPTTLGAATTIVSLQPSQALGPAVNTTGWTWPSYVLKQAQRLVLNIPAVSGLDYTLAVYNCAAHNLIGVTPDTSTIYQDGLGFFAFSRRSFDMNSPSSGVISSSNDQGTGNSIMVPESLQNLTIGDLWYFKTPWGRAFLTFEQDFGQMAGLS